MTVKWDSGIVYLAGDFDLANQQLIRDAIGAAVGHGSSEITIDMAGVSFCDASSMGVLVEATRLDLDVTVRRPSPPAARVLQLTHVDELVTVTDN